MAFELVVALWQDVNFGLPKRVIVADTGDLGEIDFNNKTSAVGVHPGPNYEVFKNANGKEPEVSLYALEKFEGPELRLTVGTWANIQQAFSFGDVISSVRFRPPSTVTEPISPIPLVVELFKETDFKGDHVVVVENSSNISADFGSTFNNTVSSVRVTQGPDFTAGFSAARLFLDNDFAGGNITLPPGDFPNLGQSHPAFDNEVSSIQVR